MKITGPPFKRILIANRGEIAVRVIRACREMGIESCSVYSDADRRALHVLMADRAWPLGDPVSRNSYLNIEKILDAARAMDCEAIHPGYGFLAENAGFARQVEESGLTFIGPPAACIEAMGSKTAARQAASDAGVPVVPGAMSHVSEDELEKLTGRIGYPVLLKATAGGGGKGMRIVRDPQGLDAAFRGASSEAGAAFADSSVYVEKYFENAHHIEVQVLFDNHGHGVYLGERECSVQRRYQKVLEETPSPFIDDAIRATMGECAVRLASAVGYRNAGTMEFLVDDQRNFYFLEMNTRLQVEHPVTEMVTSIDLVKEQIRLAAGDALGYGQHDIHPRGHAIECRIYAEDVENDFLPSPGRIVRLDEPGGGPGIRNDSGVYEGFTVPIYYDPLISKLVAWGRDRAEAIGRMRRALREYHVTGIKTTIPLMHMILAHPGFVAGNYSTSLIDRLTARRRGGEHVEDVALAALAVQLLENRRAKSGPASGSHGAASAWKRFSRAESLRKR
ncbi:MAG: acetyl-CoA carboxylase biotin carboxylase subunit [Acidobacteria bacterium]|nr:acetyl-CoA carboxylase biotin carboxylase subunit [Acidobacteriota bacterium]